MMRNRETGSRWRRRFLALLAGTALVVGSAANARAASILYFEDTTLATSAVPGALASLALSGSTTTATDVTDFNTQLGSGTWDIVIFGEQNGNPFSTAGANLTTYVNGGGRVLATTWRADAGGLAELLEASAVDTNGTAITTDAHPVFAGLPAAISLTSPGWGTFSRSWAPTGSAVGAGTLGAGNAVIVGHSGRTILGGPLFDTFATLAEGEALVANAIGLLLTVPLDHYLSYKIKGTQGGPKFRKFGPVVLADQFGSAKYTVVKPQQLGLPADKNGEGVFNLTTHLEEYKVKAVSGTPKFTTISDVRIINQCNDMLIQVKKPVSLLVPTNKDLVTPVAAPTSLNRDHFLCYKIGQQRKAGDIKLPKFPKGVQVDVTDQFQVNRRYDLKKITKLCVPVDKSIDGLDPPLFQAGENKGLPNPITPAPIQSPEEHLVCYQAKPAKKFIAQTGCAPTTPGDKGTLIVPAQSKHVSVLGFHLNNQFGPGQHNSVKEVELCIPSEKQLPVCGDNEINYPGEECDGTADAACPGNCDLACVCQ